MSSALIIVDVQKDFCEGGSLGVKGGNKVAEDIAWSVQNKEFWYNHVITTQDWHENPGNHWSDKPDYTDSWPVHCKVGTDGADLHPAIEKLDAIHVYKGRKTAAYSGFQGMTNESKSLNRVLKELEVKYLYIAGIAFDYCVKATAVDAVTKGYYVTILKNYTASVAPDNDVPLSTELDALGVKFY